MDDLILTGNIVLKDRQILDMGCIPYGYFRYVQSYTFMRKYANIMRYYVDILSYLYKEPISKTKQPDVLLQKEDKLIPAKEYFLRICGVNKKQSPPPLFRVQSTETTMLVNKALYDVLEHLSWQNKPQVNPVRLMATNNTPATKPGEYYIYRNPFLPDYEQSGFPPYVNVGIWPIPYPLALRDFGNTPIVTTKSFAEMCTADVVYYEGIRCDWNDNGKKPTMRYFYSDFIFSLKTVRRMLAVDPDLVFAPVYTTDRDMQSFSQEALSLMEKLEWSEINKTLDYKLRDYCKKWGHFYDTERFDREFPRFWS
ncbi:MAG: hypothetical protein IJ503_04795 [Akkermansia sp.]|nr:hypothetical protein [Akkermansia sp.]